VPAKGSFELKPGGAHLMFMDLKAPLKEGDKVPVTLKFEKAGEVKTEFAVGGMGASSAPMQHKH
jgi:copper(I)-binding protein